MDHVILVDSDRRFCRDMTGRLGARGIRVACAATAEAGKRLMMREQPGAVFAEAQLPGGGGLRVLEGVQGMEARVPVVVVSNVLSPEVVLDATARGAYDCLAKPVDDATLDALLRHLRLDGRPSQRCRAGWRRQTLGDEGAMVVGDCPQMIEALKTAGTAAMTDANVLIRGDSGTGKELLAREIHRASGRGGAFVGVNCAAVVETLMESELFGHERGAFTGATDRRPGCFEQADGGTVFLDEVGDASPAFQAKLLRVLDRGEFYRVGGRELIRPDVRVVAATNRDLGEMVDAATFRQDLYYRLSVVVAHLPPLRDRRADIPHLVEKMLLRINRKWRREVWGVSEQALERLMAYHWPGNVRELQNVITRAGLLCRGRTIQAAHLQGLKPRGTAVNRVPTLTEVEHGHIAEVLDVTGWNRGRACELLGITRPTLRRKMQEYGLVKAR